MPQFRVLEEGIEDGSPKAFVKVRNALGSTLVAAAGDVVEVFDEVNVHLLNPLLEAVDKDAKALVAKAEKLLKAAKADAESVAHDDVLDTEVAVADVPDVVEEVEQKF